jgi:hypothetical protein
MVAISNEAVSGVVGQGLTQTGYCLAQVGAGLVLALLLPQQPGQLLAPVSLPRARREVGEQCSDLARRKNDRIARRRATLEPAEQANVEKRHVSRPPGAMSRRASVGF